MAATGAAEGHARATRDPALVIVCGGRDFDDRQRLFDVLDAEHARRPIRLLLHGGARGADTLAAQWARLRGVPTQVFAADWSGDGADANGRRDQRMADAGAGRCVVFAGGAGTADMARRARVAGMDVRRVPAAGARATRGPQAGLATISQNTATKARKAGTPSATQSRSRPK